MEEMARDLKQREADLDGRERRLIRADSRPSRRGLRPLAIPAPARSLADQADRLRGPLARRARATRIRPGTRRLGAAAQRETEIEETFQKWEKARAAERERLRAELDHWVADREKLAKAAAEIDLQRQMHDAELSTCAARALAAEELVAAAVQDSGSERMKHRLAVLRKHGSGSSIAR